MKELIHLKLTLNTEAFYCIENMKSSWPKKITRSRQIGHKEHYGPQRTPRKSLNSFRFIYPDSQLILNKNESPGCSTFFLLRINYIAIDCISPFSLSADLCSNNFSFWVICRVSVSLTPFLSTMQ